VKNAWEPSWEALCEGSSDGCRPGRGCHDALATISQLANPRNQKQWVDADITGVLEYIDHDCLLRPLGDVPGKTLVRQWLKAGVIEDGVQYATAAGTPQGGVRSPLLLHVVLHGLEAAVGGKHDSPWGSVVSDLLEPSTFSMMPPEGWGAAVSAPATALRCLSCTVSWRPCVPARAR
jgi:RNA-directed DNA polymerase